MFGGAEGTGPRPGGAARSLQRGHSVRPAHESQAARGSGVGPDALLTGGWPVGQVGRGKGRGKRGEPGRAPGPPSALRGQPQRWR